MRTSVKPFVHPVFGEIAVMFGRVVMFGVEMIGGEGGVGPDGESQPAVIRRTVRLAISVFTMDRWVMCLAPKWRSDLCAIVPLPSEAKNTMRSLKRSSRD
jgi:hypothetical protein